MFEALLNSPVAAAAVGAGLGALGGRDQKQTASREVTMPENVRQGFNQLLAMSQPERVAYQPAPTERYYGMGTIFDSPEMQRLQDMEDVRAFESLLAQPQPQAQPAQQAQAQNQPVTQSAMDEAMLRNTMARYSNSKNATPFISTPLGQAGYTPAELNTLLNSPETFTNPYTGAPYSRQQAISDMGNVMRGDYGTSQEMLDRNANIGGLTYDPTPNLLGYIGPTIAGALLAGPAALGAGSFMGPMTAAQSALSGTTAQNLISTAGSQLAGRA